MNRTTDIIVAGSGLAGMAAACAAAALGKRVTLLSHGVGSLAISSGCIDILGYINGELVNDPLGSMERLSPEHPYSLVGTEAVRSSIEWLAAACHRHGLSFVREKDVCNRRLVTVMGTLKPCAVYPSTFDVSCLDDVHRIAIVSVEGMKDVHPHLIATQLAGYPEYAGREFFEAKLPCPLKDVHRNITPVDIARFVERAEGEAWLRETLAPYARLYPAILLPPILGISSSTQIHNRLESALGTKIVEMVSIPPTPAGLRIHEILRKEMGKAGVYVVENTEIVRAETANGHCSALWTSGSGGEHRWTAGQFIMATGGILAGGIAVRPGYAEERIFHLPVFLPQSMTEWTSEQVFGTSAFSCMGLRTDSSLRALDESGNVVLDNVRFAGRILAGYDFSSEKSGNGVALATGWHAGSLAGKE